MSGLGKGARECGLISTMVSFARADVHVGVNVRTFVFYVYNQFAHTRVRLHTTER